MLWCSAALDCGSICLGAVPFVRSGCPCSPAPYFASALPLSAAAAPLPVFGAGAAAEPAISLLPRLRYDPVVEDDFALSVPDNIGQVGVAGDDLRCYAARKQACPAQDHEAPVQRCAKELFHEPEGMTPFVQ